jgi:hypothetical protein
VLELPSSSLSLAVAHLSAVLEQWAGSIVEKTRMSGVQTMAGDLPTIKATTCEKSDKRMPRACSMSQDITTEPRVRKVLARSTRARVEVTLLVLFDRSDQDHYLLL